MSSSSKRDAVGAFIAAYRSLPELWDVKSPLYSNRGKKDRAYDVLVQILKRIQPDATRHSAVQKINNLRSAFRKELKKVASYKKTDNVYAPRLWYFQEFQFLVDKEILDRGESCAHGASLVTPATDDDPSSSACLAPSRKRKLISSPSQSQSMKPTRYSEIEEEECLTLAKAYATKLKKLSPDQLMFADKVINDALLDAQMGLLTRNSYIVHSVLNLCHCNNQNEEPVSAIKNIVTARDLKKKTEKLETDAKSRVTWAQFS